MKKSDEQKGDESFKKKKYKIALKHYRKSVEQDPDNPSLYEKLVKSLEAAKEKWTEKEFAESLDWTMKAQELKNPEARKMRTVLEALHNLKKFPPS